MSATGTGGIAGMLGEQGDELEMDLNDDLGGEEDLDLDVDMGGGKGLEEPGLEDDLGEEGLEDEETMVSLEKVREAVRECCPEYEDELMAKLESPDEDLEGEEDLGDLDELAEPGMGDEDLGGEEDLDVDVDVSGLEEGRSGLSSAGASSSDVSTSRECMESKISKIANLLTEDPDVFAQ